MLDAVAEVSVIVHPVPEASVARGKEYNGFGDRGGAGDLPSSG